MNIINNISSLALWERPVACLSNKTKGFMTKGLGPGRALRLLLGHATGERVVV